MLLNPQRRKRSGGVFLANSSSRSTLFLLHANTIMMPDDSQKPDNLDQDRTFVGERKKVSDDTRNLDVDATRGDAGESSSDDFQQALEAFDEAVDLAKRYDVQEELGAGGMGTVLKAVDKRLGRTVALKFLLEELGDSAQALRRFHTEAKAVAKLNHNNIVQIYEMERSAEGPFIVMEYVQGGSLVDLLGDGPLDQGTAVDIICQVCDALGVAHDRDIIHRDIKPANILMTTDGVPKLSDFGLARQTTADHGQTQVGAVLGTIDFMPPEQRQDATAVDARSDLWSLAATLYQMVTGRSPKVIRLDLVDDSLRPILAQALEEAQEDRYQSAAEFRDALRASLQATDSGVTVDVDLGSGECPACHAKNEPSRKFCRGCGETLVQSCISCNEKIPVWEQFCGECGGNQKELISALREEIDAKRERADSLVSELAFDEALEIAGEIAANQDTRLQHLKEWSGTFIEEATAEKERQRQHAADRDLEAIKHREAYDYRSAIHAIETIPVAMRTEDISSRLKQLQSDHEESDELLSQIRTRLKDKELDGLLDLVNRAVELRGDREDLQKLQVKLLDRAEKLARERDSDEDEAMRLAPLPPTPEMKAVRGKGHLFFPHGMKNADEYESAIEQLGPDNYVQCPSCSVAVKAKNLLIHYNKAHKGNWPSVGQVARLEPQGSIPTDPLGRATLSAEEQLANATANPPQTEQHGAVSAVMFFLAIGILIAHIYFSGWHTLGLCGIGIVILFITAVAVGDKDAPGYISFPFCIWGIIWLVGWVGGWIWGWFF